jgi:hypothetical protein
MKPYEAVREGKGVRIQKNSNHPRNKIENMLKEKSLQSMSKSELVKLAEYYMQLNGGGNKK